jgi:hypothetical protein
MAILSVTEVSDDREGTDDYQFRRKSSRVFMVTCSSNFDDDATILTSPLIPPVSSPHPNDPLKYVKERKCSNTSESKRVWKVVCTYDSVFEFNTGEENPLARPATYSFGGRTVEEAIIQDLSLDRVTLLNSAGQPFLPPVQREKDCTTIEIVKNVRKDLFTFLFAPALRNTINRNAWIHRYSPPGGHPPKTCKCTGVDAEEIFEKAGPIAIIFGDLTIGSDHITNLSDSSLLKVGQIIVCDHIPNPASIVAVGGGMMQITQLAQTTLAGQVIRIYDDRYIKVKYRIEVAPYDYFNAEWELWQAKILNAGYYCFDANGKLTVMLDDYGKALSAPGLLTEDGKKLPKGDEPVYKFFEIYFTADWSVIPVDVLG